ncbi:hypothetical protein CMV_017505 [Castanea mollissima]|uniref:Uncharacterized protein n=1 Tax=Castanea mollissima TaxID=60419 RepID=A0A8J4R4G8_9ROSI|nr:hypothetical protein CMV_017505 [Castanea mollissima]
MENRRDETPFFDNTTRSPTQTPCTLYSLTPRENFLGWLLSQGSTDVTVLDCDSSACGDRSHGYIKESDNQGRMGKKAQGCKD